MGKVVPLRPKIQPNPPRRQEKRRRKHNLPQGPFVAKGERMKRTLKRKASELAKEHRKRRNSVHKGPNGQRSNSGQRKVGGQPRSEKKNNIER